MNFHRSYDISCVSDELRRRGLENAIEAINLACNADTDAWLYVESKKIHEDYTRDYGPHETMKNTIFNHMKLHGHSGGSIGVTIYDLVNMATEYSTWKRAHEEQNSIYEGEKVIIDEFKRNTLVPYYRSMSGGGSRSSAGPIVSEFLEIYDRLQHRCLPEVTSIYTSPRLSTFREFIRQRLNYETKMDDYQNTLIKEQLPILRAAIESRNPVALKSALNPGWGSMTLYEQKEYKEADALLAQLEDT